MSDKLSVGLDGLLGDRGATLNSSGAKDAFTSLQTKFDLSDGKQDYEPRTESLWQKEIEYFGSLKLIIDAYNETIEKINFDLIKEVLTKRRDFFLEANKMARKNGTVGNSSEMQAGYTDKVIRAIDDKDNKPVTKFIADAVKKAIMEEISQLQFIDWIVARDTMVRSDVEKLFSKRPSSKIGVDEPFKWIVGSYKKRLEEKWNQAGNIKKTKADMFLNKFSEIFDSNLKVKTV